ncbi:MAG: hypothetical protein IKP95_11460 [Ruminococcus sp.]|nr:hypothetical protein [Ruminococcus sp.]
MVKRSVLTPVLSGVLAVTVAGSGVLYVMDKKDSDEAKDTVKTDASNSAFARVKDKVEATAEKVGKAIDGELDFSYSGKLELEFGSAVTKQLGAELKNLSIEASTKQKGGMSQADITAAYGDSTLATVNLVEDNANKVFYVKCPELNEAYLYGSTEEIAKAMDDYKSNLSSGLGINMMATAGTNIASQFNAEQLQQMLNDLDLEGLESDIEEYAEVIKEKIPEGTDSGNLEGDIDGHSYSYTVKTIDVTNQVIVDIANAVVDKAKDDQFLKDYAKKAGLSDSDFENYLNSAKEALTKTTGQDLSQTLFTVDIYYLDDQARGFGLDMGEQGVIKMVAIDDGTVIGIDLSASIAKSNTNASLKGAFDSSNDELNGSIVLDVSSDSSKVKASLSADKLKTEGDLFSGTLKANVEADGKSIAFEFTSASTSDKLDVTTTLDIDNENAFKLKLTGAENDASDVEIPTGTAYKLDEEGLKAYLESCNTDGFMANVKSAVGEDVLNKLTGNRNNNVIEDDDDDYWDL